MASFAQKLPPMKKLRNKTHAVSDVSTVAPYGTNGGTLNLTFPLKVFHTAITHETAIDLSALETTVPSNTTPLQPSP